MLFILKHELSGIWSKCCSLFPGENLGSVNPFEYIKIFFTLSKDDEEDANDHGNDPDRSLHYPDNVREEDPYPIAAKAKEQNPPDKTCKACFIHYFSSIIPIYPPLG